MLQAGVMHVVRPHYRSCPHTSRRYRRCKCPIWVQDSLGGQWVDKFLNLTSWEAASDLMTAWTVTGQIGMVRPDVPLLAEAAKRIMADARGR